MKKLIVAACAIAIALVGQAATVKWNTKNVYVPGTETKASNYMVYWIDSSDYSYTDALADLAKDPANISFVSTYGQAEKATGSTGKATNTITDDADPSSTWTGYCIVVDAASLAAATKVYITTEESATVGGTGQGVTINYDAATSATASNWYAIPEPTSGLLLLLGVAGLALRRRRA